MGWQTIFSQPPTELWNPMVTSSLSAVAIDGTRELALNVMVRATNGRAVALHRLLRHRLRLGGARAPPVPGPRAARFWERIDHVQYTRTERAGAGPRTTEEER